MNKEILRKRLTYVIYIIFFILLIFPWWILGVYLLDIFCNNFTYQNICELKQSWDEQGLLLFAWIGILILWSIIWWILYKLRNK